jgi:spermidine synthase
LDKIKLEHRLLGVEAIPPLWMRRVLYACFLLSGAAGLIYQISWMKALIQVFGGTTYAITAVLCAFMAGLALGSWLLGRYAEQARQPLRLYGWIELGIALTGLASLCGIWLSRWAYVQAYEFLSDYPALLLGYRFLTSFLILLLPATLMGGTYPVVVKYLTRRREELGALASRLYWLNTAGAIIGACLAGFVLLWHLGLLRTVFVAAGLNLTVASLVLVSSVRFKTPGIDALKENQKEMAEIQEEGVPSETSLILLVTGISGLGAMMFEIGWTRILAIFLSSTTYAFTLMLATFLFGITLGSYLFERWHRRWRLSLNLLGYFLIILALGGLLFLVMSRKLAELTLWIAYASGESGARLLGGQFIISFLAMIIPTTLFGLTFPLTVVLYCGGDRRRGARTGRLYAVNTLGAILGSFITGLFLIQWIGTVNTLLLASGLMGAVATALFMRVNPIRSWRHAVVGLGLLIVIVGAGATKAFEHPVLHVRTVLGGAARRDFVSRLTMEEIVQFEKLIYVKEGVNSTVSVAQRQGTVFLRTNGKSEASTSDKHTQLMLAYLPLSLHSQPRSVLVVGFGSGSTVYSATQLSAAAHLEELNHGAQNHPNVRVILDDARNHLMVTHQRYDIIISEPSYLWSRGISTLFTREFYRQVREHLAPNGLFVQWVQAYQMAPRDLCTVLRTLATTFNHVSMWWGGGNDLVLLASSKTRGFSLKSLEGEFARNAKLRGDLKETLSISEPAGLLGYFLLDDPAVRKMAANGDINTDDRTVLEYSVPLNIAKQTIKVNYSEIGKRRQEALPSFLELPDGKAAALAGAETQVQAGLLNRPLGAPLVKEALTDAPESVRTLMLRASVDLTKKRYTQAIFYLQRAEKRAANNAEVAFRLGKLYWDQGQGQTARKALEKCLRLDPLHLEGLKALTSLELRAGRQKLGLALQKRVIAAKPRQLYVEWSTLGKIYMAAGQTKEALESFQRSLKLEPLGYLAHRNMAGYFARTGDAQKAIQEYRFLIQYYPAENPDLYLRLSDLYVKIGDEGEARRILGKAKRIFPTDARVRRRL